MTCFNLTVRRVASTYLVVLLLSSMLLSLSSTLVPPAQAGTKDFKLLTLNFLPDTGPPGTWVTVTGTLNNTVPSAVKCSFTASHPNFFDDTPPTPAPSCTVTGNAIIGAFRVRAPERISPAKQLPGLSYTVTVSFSSLPTGWAFDPTGNSRSFVVTPRIGFSSSPATAQPWPSSIIVMDTQVVYVHGWGFNASSTFCTLTALPNAGVITLPSCSISAGELTGQFTVSNFAGTTQNVTATGNVFGENATGTVTIATGPALQASPPWGAAGMLVTVTGVGFSTSDTSCAISYLNTTFGALFTSVPACTISPPIGSWKQTTATFTVATTAGVGKNYTLMVQGSPTMDVAYGYFYVNATPTVVLNPSTGPPGTTVLVQSTTTTVDFSPADAGLCTITTVPTGLISSYVCLINATGQVVPGSFFAVSSATPGGGYAVTVTGSQGDRAQATFIATTLPSITLTPTSGTGGDTIQVNGLKFSLGATACTITANATLFQAPPSCSVSSGTVTGSFVVGTSDVAARTYNVTVRMNTFPGNPDDWAYANFTVRPKISLTPGSAGNPARVGANVTISGSNFAVADALKVCTVFSIPSGGINNTAWSCAIDSHYMLAQNGTFTSSFIVAFNPALTSYTITVTGTGTTPPAPSSASATLYIVPRVVVLSPDRGPRGSVVKVSGTGFSLGDTGCSVTSPNPNFIVGTPTPCSITGGTIIASIAVNSSSTFPQGYYAVNVTGQPGGDWQVANFLVTPGIVLSLTSGRPGTVVTISGSGFAAGDTGCGISSSPTGLISSPSCSMSSPSGTMAGSFIVAATAPSGVYQVIVTGTPTLDAGNATFTVPLRSTLILNPILGPAGTPVSASGLNYQGTTCLLSAPGLFTSQSCVIAGGTLTGSFTVAPAALPGTVYTVTADTNAGPTDSASATFSVITGPVGTLTLTPTSGLRGTLVVGTASGFATDTACILTSSPAGILSSASCTITGAGNVNVGFTVAATALAGTYTILAVGNTGKSAAGSFTVTAPPITMTLNPTSGPVGTAVAVSGSGYAGTTCAFSSTPSGLFTSATCSISGGTLSGGFTVASGATGGYTVTVETDIAESKTATFSVEAPTLTLNPASGSGGTVVTVSGSNYGGASCTMSSTPSGLFTSPSCSISGGTLSGGFTVASSATVGSYTVGVGTDIGELMTRTFTVTTGPSFTLSPIQGPRGTVVSGSGVGYAGTECTLSSTPSGLLSSPSCAISAGTLTAGFTVATSAAAGTYNVIVETDAPETVTRQFTVIVEPFLTLSPASGRAGTAVVASGSNFVGTTCSLSASPGSLFTSSSCSISAGTLTGGFTVASGASAGSYTVTVTTNVAGEARSVTFTVTGLRPCIIATATFGSEVSSAVQFLRSFRDGLVLSTRAGSAFMDVFNAWYYSFSPSVAGLIGGNDLFRATVRVILYPLLGILGISALTYSLLSAAPEFAVVMAGLVASSLIGLVYLTPFTFVGMRALTKRRRIKMTSLAKVSLTLLAAALALLAAGELTGSYLLLAAASSAVVLTCIIAAPAIAALAVLRAKLH